jgi:hypothetical protein
MNSSDSDDSISRPSSCYSRSGSDGSDTSPSSASSRSSDGHRTIAVQPVLEARAVSRWEIDVPYNRVRDNSTHITVNLTDNRFDGDQSRDPSLPAHSHESAIDSLVDYLDDVVPTGAESRDGRTLELVRRCIRTSGRFGGGLLVR